MPENANDFLKHTFTCIQITNFMIHLHAIYIMHLIIFVQLYRLFLSACAKLRKATISFVMFVCLAVRPHGTTRFLLDGFSWNLIFEYFQKSVEKIPLSLKSEKNSGYFICRAINIFIISRPVLRMINFTDKSCSENHNTFYVQWHFFFRKSCRLWDVQNMVQPDRPQMTIRRMRTACPKP
jgi:hypothetical protein